MLEKQFMSKDESFKYTIEDLRSIISLMDEIKGFALVNKVGLPIAFLLPEEIDDYLIAAYSSAILSIVEQATQIFEHGELEQMYIRSIEGYLLIMPWKMDTILVLETPKRVNIGIIFEKFSRYGSDDLVGIVFA